MIICEIREFSLSLTLRIAKFCCRGRLSKISFGLCDFRLPLIGSPMELLNSIIDDEPELERQLFILIFIAVASLAIYGLYSATGYEAPAEFSVPIPEQCSSQWNGHTLEKPEIKVHFNPLHYLNGTEAHRLIASRYLAQAPFNATAQRTGDCSVWSTQPHQTALIEPLQGRRKRK